MLLLAYVVAVGVAVLAATVGQRWIDRPARASRIRVLAGVLATVYAAVVTSVVAMAQGGLTPAVAWIFALLALAGAALHVWGLLRWRGRAAWGLRLAGWLTMIAAGIVPSHLTLVLPLIAPLAVTLRAEGPAAETSWTRLDGSSSGRATPTPT